MKYTLHIPTEQYGFVAIEVEGQDLMSVADKREEEMSETVVALYRQYADAFKPKPVNSLKWPDFQKILDTYLEKRDGGAADDYEGMSEAQKKIMQSVKRRFKRDDR